MTRIHFDQARYPEEAAALRAIPEDAPVRVFGIDLVSPAQGVTTLIAARRTGLTTAVLPILPDPYEAMLASILQAVASAASEEDRAGQINALRAGQLLVNGKQPHELVAYDRAHKNAAALVLRLADVLLIGSPGERGRWARLLGRPFHRFAFLAVPVQEPATDDALDEAAVTVFAPSTPRALLAAYEAALRQQRLDVCIISAESASQRPLSRVVVAPEWRPIRARALAARGYRVVTPNATRVEDCDERIFGYSAPDLRAMQAAVAAAFAASAAGASRIAGDPPATSNAIARYAATCRDGPLVSVIIRTCDRPELLRHAVASVAAQTYRNVEIIVVNNGGEDVRSTVEAAAQGRPYRYAALTERRHISAASNAGVRAAAGEYIGYVDDDDLLYADHCALTVDAIERTRADVVFTTCLAEYAQVTDGRKRVLGYQIFLDRDFHPDDIYVNNVTPIHTIVHRRDVFDRFGYFDESLPVTDDWELWLRIASAGGRFVRIDRVTCEYSWRSDPQQGNMTIQRQWDFVLAYREITQRYAAHVEGRTRILQEQAAALCAQEARARRSANLDRRANVVIEEVSNAAIVPAEPEGANAASPD